MPVCHRLTTQGCVLSKFAHRPTLLHRSNTNIEYFIKMATQTEFYLSSSADLFEMISAHCFLITTLLHWTLDHNLPSQCSTCSCSSLDTHVANQRLLHSDDSICLQNIPPIWQTVTWCCTDHDEEQLVSSR